MRDDQTSWHQVCAWAESGPKRPYLSEANVSDSVRSEVGSTVEAGPVEEGFESLSGGKSQREHSVQRLVSVMKCMVNSLKERSDCRDAVLWGRRHKGLTVLRKHSRTAQAQRCCQSMTDGEEQINVHVYVQMYTKSIGQQSRRSEGRSLRTRVSKTGRGEAKVQEEVGLPVT